MPTFKITLAYDGTNFVGWQRQAAGTSIQGLLEDALRDLDNRAVVVNGAGRTDAGVHALGQVAGFALERPMSAGALARALNARLPGDVRVLAAEEVAPTFRPRFGARLKTYRYRIWHADVMNPFDRLYAWHVDGRLDVEGMAEAARLIEGRHDFAAFQASGGSTRTTEREVFRSKLLVAKLSTTKLLTTEDTADTENTEDQTLFGTGLNFRVPRVRGGELVTYEITGNGFLRHMVRNIAGTLVEIGRGRRPAAWIGEVLASRDRARAGPTAPADGLFLVAVEYGDGPL